MLFHRQALPRLELSLPLYFPHSRPTPEHGYDATIVISALRYTQSGMATPNISWFRLFERVVHCPLILDFSCIYTGSTVNGNRMDAHRMSTSVSLPIENIFLYILVCTVPRGTEK